MYTRIHEPVDIVIYFIWNVYDLDIAFKCTACQAREVLKEDGVVPSFFFRPCGKGAGSVDVDDPQLQELKVSKEELGAVRKAGVRFLKRVVWL